MELDNKKDVAFDPSKWVEEYGDYLYNFAYTRLWNRTVAEDLVQETFLNALKSRDSFKGLSSELTWMVSILKNLIRDYKRKLFREIEWQKMAEDDEHAESFNRGGKWKGHWDPKLAPKDWGDSPDALLENKEFWEIVEYCLEKLPQQYAVVFVWYQLKEIESKVICKELSLTESNLYSIMHRARSRLRHCIEENWVIE